MHWKHTTWIVLIALLAVVSTASLLSPPASRAEALMQELIFSGDDFGAGSGHDFVVTGAGLVMADTAFTTLYTSPELEAPIPFNAVVPQWRAALPEGSDLTVLVRTRTAVSPWSDWFDIHEHHDWTEPEEERIVGEMITVPAADERHTHIQFSLQINRNVSLITPVVNEFTLTFIDSTEGPTVDEMVAQQQALDAAGDHSYQTTGYPRPPVISRSVWCIYEECSYTEDLEYAPATHMVVHHTVSNNANSDWAAVMRAIWQFHTHSRGWGDIGYNYLIDINGVVYEGHLSEDYANLDVVGTHAGGANTGSMGVALLGTFTAPDDPDTPGGIAPSTPMVNSLVALLSWKADQRKINVYDAGNTLPNIGWGLPYLMGHRDVYGTTECPGDQVFVLLPQLRERVAANIGLVNPYIVVDERSSAFTRSSGAWYQGLNECGNNGHSFYTWSTMDAASGVNWGVWRPNVPENGRYRIDVRVPYCYTGRSETGGAVYTINHAGGTSTVTVDQNTNVGLWITLGEFDLNAGTGNSVRLTNLTTSDEGLGVWFDDLRLLRVKGELHSSAPAADVWLNNRTVTFSWALNQNSTVRTSALRVAATESLAAPLVDQSWAGSRFTHTQTFTQDHAALYWQATAVLDHTNEAVVSPVTRFGIDTGAPSSAVSRIFSLSGDYLLLWQGSDALSGVAAYNVSYRPAGSSAWISWLTATTATNGRFTPPDPGKTYEFRVQAVDRAGNVEAKTAVDAATEQAIDLPHAIMLPMIRKP